MKKILGLAIVAIAIIAMAGVGTYAYFSDTEESTGNIIQAGTLDLGLANSSGTNPVGGTTVTFSTPDNWKPADTQTIKLYVNNEGTIDMATVTLDFDLGALNDGTPSSVDEGTTKLEDMVSITTATWGTTSVTDLVSKTLKDLNDATTPYTLGSLNADSEKLLEIKFTFNTAADNGCQGDKYPAIKMTLKGEQSHTGVDYPVAP